MYCTLYTLYNVDMASNFAVTLTVTVVDSAAPFIWQGAGASVFGATARGAAGDDDAADDDVERPPDVEFEPIVSLPEVEVVTGEEDETVRRFLLNTGVY